MVNGSAQLEGSGDDQACVLKLADVAHDRGIIKPVTLKNSHDLGNCLSRTTDQQATTCLRV
jgi:hypothetical protein